MPKGERIASLDIGTTKICAIIGELLEDERIEIKGVGLTRSLGIKKGVVVNIDQAVKAIGNALSEAELMAGKETPPVYASITGSHIKGENLKGMITIPKTKEISDQEVERVIASAKPLSLSSDRTILHVLPQQFIIDGQNNIKDPVGMNGTRLEVNVHVVTAAETAVSNITKCILKTGCKIEELVLEALACSYAVLTPDEQELGVVLVDIGGNTTNISVFLDGALYYTDILAVGGEIVTKDISIGLRTSIFEAERLKREYGCCLRQEISAEEFVTVQDVGRTNRKIPRQALVEIIEPRMEELFTLINQQIRISGYENLTAAGVVLTGGGAMLEGTKELAERILDMPVRIGYPTGVEGMLDQIKSAAFGTSIGLLLYAGKRKQRLAKKTSPKGIFKSIKDWFKELFT
jgi:cell division protein FtsA